MHTSLPSYGIGNLHKKFKPHGKYRPLAINYTGETEINKPIKCAISSEEIPFHLLRPDGKDVVFLDENGNILPYWIETKNSTLMQVWLKFPKASKSFLPIYMYYNNLRDVKISHISAAFKYRRRIIITEQSGSDLTDYQVLIELDSSNFDFSKTQTNGEDIRFADANGNLLPYWIEEWDAVNKRAKVWVKVPTIPANSSVEIWMYYGNPKFPSASDGGATFDFFDDFSYQTSTLQKIYSCENGAYGDNEDGKPAALFLSPQAIYDSSQNKVYIVYQGSGYDPYIFYYDVANKTISDNVKVGDNPTADSRWGDAHAAPTLWIDPDGYIHVLYGGHGTPIKHSKSTNPYDISSWTLLSDFASAGTYPFPVVDGSNVYVFFRKPDGYRYYKKSTDGGNTFGSDVQWCSTGGIYYNYVRKGNKVHFAIWYSGTGDLAKEVRYFYFDLNTETFHKIDGTELSIPFAFTDADLAWSSPTGWAETAAIAADDNGHIYIIAYARQSHDTPAVEHGDVYAIKWNGSSWQAKDTGIDVKFASGNQYLAVKSASEIYLYIVEMDSNGCGAFRKYSSSNGLDFTLGKTIADKKACRMVHTVYDVNLEPIGGITFNNIITMNNVDRDDPHLGLYGDDFPPFESPGLNSEIWDSHTSKGSIDVNNSLLILNGNADASGGINGIRSKSTFSPPLIVEFKLKITAPTSNYAWKEFGVGDTDLSAKYLHGGNNVIIRNQETGYTYITSKKEGSATTVDMDSTTTWHIESIYWNSVVKNYWDYELKAEVTSNIPTIPLYIMIGAGNNAGENAIECDWVRVRKYTEPEPSVSLGAEEGA